MNRIGLMGLILFSLSPLLFAQIMNQNDVPEQPALAQGSGGPIIPILKLGVQTVDAIGYNFNTGASGIAYDTSNSNLALDTMAFFDILFVDSRTGQPLYYEVGADPDVWSVHFKIRNFTARINSANPSGLEVDEPSWVAELQGHGFKFGVLTQGGTEIQGTAYPASSTTNNPVIGLVGADEVLNLSAGTDYIIQYGSSATPSPNSVAYYGSASGTSGILYLGYGVPGLFQTYVSTLSQGDVNSATSGSSAAQGWAFAFNGTATPVGAASDKQPLAVTIKADAIKGFNFTNSKTSFSVSTTNVNQGNTGGFGLSTQVDYWLGRDFLISPIVAFDGRLNDMSYAYSGTTPDAFQWEVGGGLMLTMSPKKFVNDDWNELSTVASTLENNKIEKFAYFQAMGQYSKKTDADLAFKFELPVKINTFAPDLDTMWEYRVSNLNSSVITYSGSTYYAPFWSLTGRVSYDVMNHSVVPYVRWYANGSNWNTLDTTTAVKLRLGVQMAVIPGFGLEATYLSPQVYGSGTVAQNFGKFEVITVFNTDGGAKTLTPKTMNFTDWDTQ